MAVHITPRPGFIPHLVALLEGHPGLEVEMVGREGMLGAHGYHRGRLTVLDRRALAAPAHAVQPRFQ